MSGPSRREAYGSGCRRGAREPDDRVFAAAAVLSEGSVLGGWAAAWLRGVTSVDGLSRAGDPLPVTVVVPPEGFVLRGRGVRCRRSDLTASSTSPAEARCR